MKQPNILWVSFEDTSPFYGCYGDPLAVAPTVDRLAAEGCRWTHAFSTAGVCAPARCAIITGMYAISIGAHHMRTTHRNDAARDLPTPYSVLVPHDVKCFPEYLRAAGYWCTNNVKTDYQFEPPRTAWDELSETAHWRNRPDRDQPFFAVFNLTRSHESGMWSEKTPEPTVDPATVPVPPLYPDTPAIRSALARMYSNIAYNDGLLANLLDDLEEDGHADDTVVFHWSDHGPLPRGKRWPYDTGIHVPLIVRWPEHLQPGSVSEQLVSTIDLGPTVLSIAGVPVPPRLQGRAFLGTAAEEPRKYVFASRDRHDESYDRVRAARDRRFKYIRNYHPELPRLPWVPYRDRHPILEELRRLELAGRLPEEQRQLFQRRPAEELYDTAVDPWEMHDLAADATADPAHATMLRRLRAALDDWLTDVGDMGEIDEAEMVRRWYPDGVRPATAPPRFVLHSTDGTTALVAGESVEAVPPAALQLYCATEGASLAFQIGPPGDHWQLYCAPLRLSRGDTTVRARAIRIGYAESEERGLTVTVR